MKKRNKPVFLIAVLVLIGGGAIAMNSNLLSTPKTAEDYAKQADEQQAELAKTTSSHPHTQVAPDPKAKPEKGAPGMAGGQDDGSLVRPKGENEGLGVNIKAVPAVGENDPKINAPIVLKNKITTQDRASVAVQGQWYAKESGANTEHPGK